MGNSKVTKQTHQLMNIEGNLSNLINYFFYKSKSLITLISSGLVFLKVYTVILCNTIADDVIRVHLVSYNGTVPFS